MLPEVSSASSMADGVVSPSSSSSPRFSKSPVGGKNPSTSIPPKKKNDGSSSTEQDIVFTPKDVDVLCGRGRAIRLHPGNQVYNRLLREGYEEYTNAKKGTKLDIVRRIVVEIRDERGGRFLERLVGGGTYFIDIGNERAMNKTAQAFRDMRVAETNGTLDIGCPTTFDDVNDDVANGDVDGVTPSSAINGPASSSSLAKKSMAVSSSSVRRPAGTTNTAVPTFFRRGPLLNNRKKTGSQGGSSTGSALLAAAAAKAKAAGPLPGQPRRLSFSERIKLLNEQQRKQQRKKGSDDDDSDDDDDSESGSEEGDGGGGGEVSETETEDSFPMYRGKNDE